MNQNNFSFLLELIKNKLQNCIGEDNLNKLSKKDIEEVVKNGVFKKSKIIKQTYFDELPKDIIYELTQHCKSRFTVSIFLELGGIFIEFKNEYIEGAFDKIEFNKKNGYMEYYYDCNYSHDDKNIININEDIIFTYSFDSCNTDDTHRTVAITIPKEDYANVLLNSLNEINAELKTEDLDYNELYINKKGYLCGRKR